MSGEIILLVAIVVLLVSMFMGNWVFVSLGMAGVVGLLLMGTPTLNMIGPIIWDSVTNQELSAIPLFVFMGEIVLKGGLSTSFYEGVSRLLGWLPGGLLHTNVVASACFAAISGSSVATTATIGTVAIKEQLDEGYNRRLVLGSIAASGTLGILIPPSINMIVYGAWVECSVGQLFMGGVIPGIIMALLFMAYIYTRVLMNPLLAPMRVRWKPKEMVAGAWGMIPMAVIMIFIFISVYTGFMTPTETAAGSAFISVLIVLFMGKLNWKVVQESATAAIRTSCMILFIYLGAKILVYVMVSSGIPSRIPQIIGDWNLSRTQVLIAICIMFIILGCFMDGISMILLTMPFLMPVLISFQIDLVWFGILLIILTEIGMLTPPLGLTLYVVLGLDKTATIAEASLSILPFIFLSLLVITLVILAPDIALWLPRAMALK
ncbi:MAG: C4-dicarboxylate ABC transporter permease [Deltaproteobacteria bacterium]|nr:MAG: C4-dicarboxylate ABC transporter permease [Deltaproteobacteria bacterium]